MIGARGLWRGAGAFARLLAGMPPYEAYLTHMHAHHPEATPMSEAEFCRDRQAARYGGKPGSSGCC